MSEFEIGDVVVLRSGGPQWTVVEVVPPHKGWFTPASPETLRCIREHDGGMFYRCTLPTAIMEVVRRRALPVSTPNPPVGFGPPATYLSRMTFSTA